MSETTEHTSSWAIGDLEPEIVGLRATIGILGHLIQSPFQVEKSEWCKVEDELVDYAKRIEALWHQAWDADNAKDAAHEAQLAAVRDEAKAQKAAPGSKEDADQVDAAWIPLAAAVKVAGKRCIEAGYELEPFGPKSIPTEQPEQHPERMRW
jgi:hypothetical protein